MKTAVSVIDSPVDCAPVRGSRDATGQRSTDDALNLVRVGEVCIELAVFAYQLDTVGHRIYFAGLWCCFAVFFFCSFDQ